MGTMGVKRGWETLIRGGLGGGQRLAGEKGHERVGGEGDGGGGGQCALFGASLVGGKSRQCLAVDLRLMHPTGPQLSSPRHLNHAFSTARGWWRPPIRPPLEFPSSCRRSNCTHGCLSSSPNLDFSPAQGVWHRPPSPNLDFSPAQGFWHRPPSAPPLPSPPPRLMHPTVVLPSLD